VTHNRAASAWAARLGNGHFLGRADEFEPGVVDQDPDGPMIGGDLADDSGHGLFAGNVKPGGPDPGGGRSASDLGCPAVAYRFDRAFSAGSGLAQQQAVAIVRDQRGTGTQTL
jgi:hypothetical protein